MYRKYCFTTHSWHCGLFPSTAPNSAGDENCESGIPVTYPFPSMSRSMVFGGDRLPPPPSPRPLKNCSVNFSRLAPTASNFSSPNPIGSISLWQVAQLGLVACSDIRSRLVCGLASVTGGRFVFTPAGGSGTCWHRNCSRTNRPRAVGDESSGLAVDARNSVWPSTPARSDSGVKAIRSNSFDGGGTL